MTTKLAPQAAPADDQVLKDVAAQIAAGKDPFGDDDDDTDTGTVAVVAASEGEGAADDLDAADTAPSQEEIDAAEAAAATTAAETAAAEGAAEGEGQQDLSVDALEAVVGNGSQPAPLPQYQVPDIDFATERKAITTQQKAIEKKWSDGEIDDDERIDKLAELQDQRDALVRAETIATLNHDGQRQSDQTVLNNLAAASAKAGEIDYLKDESASIAFNNLLPAVKADPANKGKSYAEIAQATHDALCAVRGVKRKASAAPAPAPAPAPAAAATRKTPPAAPVTLRGVPSASTPNTGGDWKDDMSKLEGQEWQDAFNKLPQSRKDELLA